jgi:AcrR family transcriptional regulator
MVTSRQRRKLERPQELLDAALCLFVQKGFAATRAEEVAQQAGVSKGTLYLYYPSKEELFKAVVRNKITNIIAEGMGLVDCFEGSASDLLRALMAVWWEKVGNTEAAGIHKIIVAEVRNFPDLAQFYVDEVMKPADELLSRALQIGVDRGEFRPVNLLAATKVLIAPYIFLATHQHSLGACNLPGLGIDTLEVLTMHLDFTLRGLRADPVAVAVAAPAAARATTRSTRSEQAARPVGAARATKLKVASPVAQKGRP